MSRRLKPDEAELWRKVAESTQRLHQDRRRPTPEAAKPKPKQTLIQPDPHPDFHIGQSAYDRGPSHDILHPIRDRLAKAPIQMDRKAHAKMTRGKLAPEARVDLHGMTLDRAHGVLTGFILRASGEGKRLVLVITGKGRDRDDGDPIPVRRGVLRHQVPHWLSTPPLAALVLQITPAHLRHGGDGAYYIYLRRSR
ncbi:Smr/MutS family protein [Pseudooceanicola sp.]|uniref:Smr/MutS family protein n=1 Tax=Pseudooceanicola sp. TaxID=1914328 RepID=UPI00261BA831|nr:Smr/MutS family protein [Pseudooceanicola sp.]MDF1854942.1 Smr/MutS family protein [Pseudooceanicola sp.]